MTPGTSLPRAHQHVLALAGTSDGLKALAGLLSAVRQASASAPKEARSAHNVDVLRRSIASLEGSLSRVDGLAAHDAAVAQRDRGVAP